MKLASTTFWTSQTSRYRLLVLHDPRLFVSQSRFLIGYLKVFSTIYQIVLSYPDTLYHYRRIDIDVPSVAVFYPFSASHTQMDMMRHSDLVLSIGFEVVSLQDKATPILSLPQQKSTSRIARLNAETLQEERDGGQFRGQCGQMLPQEAHALLIALSRSNLAVWLKSSHLCRQHLQSSEIQFRALPPTLR